MAKYTKKHPDARVCTDDPRRPATRGPTSTLVLWLSLGLFLLTATVFFGAGRNEYINYDDPDYVTANPHVQKGLTGEMVAWAFKTGHACNWHPITWMSHMADWKLFGGKPGPAHLVSVTLHATNAMVLFLVLWGLTALTWRSWFVAALFALHPLHVESVAWVSERKDVLSAFFFLLSLAAYGNYARASGARRWWGYGTALAMFALGLLSKPMVVTLPFVLLLLDYWPLGRLTFATGQGSQPSVTLVRLLAEKAPFFLLSAGSSVVTYLVQQRGGAVSAGVEFGDRLINALVAYALYLRKTIWPLDLAVFYPHPGKWPWLAIVAAAGIIAGVSLWAWWAARRKPYLAVGWLLFLGMLVPVIGLVQVGMQALADRYTYLPLIGVFVAVVWLVADEWSARRWAAPGLAALGGAILLGCAFLTVKQLGYWRDSETLFRRALGVTRDNFLAYNNLGHHYGSQGLAAEEMKYYRKSLELNPDFLQALNNVASALAARGQFAEAVPYFERALAQAPEQVKVRVNLANALAEMGELDRAIPHYEAALKLEHRDADTLNQLGVALARAGRANDALARFEEALKVNPRLSPAYENIGNVYALQRRWEDALREYGRALDADRNNPQLHFIVGGVLARLNRPAEAAAEYREALRLKPDHAEAAKQLKAMGGE